MPMIFADGDLALAANLSAIVVGVPLAIWSIALIATGIRLHARLGRLGRGIRRP
ncbi:MAG: hypothetical protein U0800_26090 [Isosphaeraceae bacterium]